MVNLVDPKPYNPKPLNGKQFSQMGLFAQPKPSPEHQWRAHGYSPERRAEISAVVPRVGVTTKFGQLSSSYFPAGESVKSKRGDAATMRNLRNATRAAVVDTLARSTMPASDLARNTPKMKVAQMPGAYGRMAAKGRIQRGEVTPIQGQITIHPLGSASRQRGGTEHTIIHEIGHHVDFEQDPTRFHTTARTEAISSRFGPPSLEGFAEGYARKHHVPRRDDPTHYRQRAAYEHLHSHPSFQWHYARASGEELSEAMGDTPHMGPQFGHQQSLFHGPTPSEGKTVATWKGDKAEDYNVGSITVGQPKRRR